MPSWYRRARLAGAWAMAIGAGAIVITFPFVGGDPGSVADSELADPAWTRVLGGVGVALLVVGLLALLAPSAHRVLARRRP